MLAWKLGRPLTEIEAMDSRQFMEWVAFFALQEDQLNHTLKRHHHAKIRGS